MTQNAQEQALRACTTEELKQRLEGNPSAEETLYGLDELEKRGEAPAGHETLQSIFAKLPNEVVAMIEHDEQRFASRTMLLSVEEKLTRKLKPLVWYYGNAGKQQGPVNRVELFALVKQGQLTADDYVWREGMDDWMKATVVNGLFETLQPPKEPQAEESQAETATPPQPPPMEEQGQQNQQNYEQHYQQPQQGQPYQQPPATPKKHRVTGMQITAGVLQFLLVPVWVITAIAMIFSRVFRHNDEAQVLVFLLCIFMAAASIAMGIGIIVARKWGYYFKFVSSVIALFWMAYMLMSVRNGEEWWIAFIFFEIVTLVLVLASTKDFR